MKGLKKRLTKDDSLMIVWQENEGTHAILTQSPVYNIDYVFRLARYRFLVYNIRGPRSRRYGSFSFGKFEFLTYETQQKQGSVNT